jgi:type IV secretory pathway VirB3-like protein
MDSLSSCVYMRCSVLLQVPINQCVMNIVWCAMMAIIVSALIMDDIKYHKH